MAVTGTYFEPYNDWPGQGPRPLIVYGPGTQGQGDQCAPSRQFNQGIHWSPWLDFAFNYEELFVATMVARGFAIVMTDYQGLGTPGLHTYVNRIAAGRRDARRRPGRDAAARHLAGSRMGRWRSGATRRAAGLRRRRPSWRRPTPRTSTSSARYAGAPPADLKELFPYADGSALVGVVGYALNSRHHHLPGIRGGDPVDADPARRGPAVQGPGPVHRRDHHQVHVSAPAALLQSRTSSSWSTRSRSRRCSTCRRIGRYKPNAPVMILQQPVRPAGAVDGGQPAGPRLVRAGRRRRSSAPTSSHRS